MGISGLLQFIRDAGEPVNVKKYKGQTVAVDTYCWLHKGAFSCAEKLAKGEPTDQYVSYCMKFVDMLLSFSVKPVLVFDGRNLPSKKEVEKTRRERREANLQRGRQLLREGKLSEARDCFTRCVNITPSMAHSLIKAARTRGVDCLVAPYEADAQLAFLTKSGLAQAVITEDSDLLAFGCRKVILKMDKQGNGLEIDQSNLGRCRSLGNVFTEDKFRHMCILSGCDYLASLHGIGLGKACKLLRLAKDPDILKVIRKMGQYLKMNLLVPDSYLQGFVRANNTFLYQLVFDPVKRQVVPLNPYPEHMDPSTLSYAGLHLGDDTGLQMALGNLDINTLEKIDDFSPDAPAAQSCKSRSHSWKDSSASSGRSVWSRGFTAAPAASTASTTSPHRPPPTRGQQRVVNTAGLRLPCRELQLKRPRDDSSVSDQDVLQLYSSSTDKRSRSDQDQDQDQDPSSCSRQPRPRNRFATLLQRRNQEAPDGHQDTRSRFFSSSSSPPAVQVSEDKSSSSDGPDAPSVETPSPPVSPCSSPLGSSHPGPSSRPGPSPLGSSLPGPGSSPLGSSLPGPSPLGSSLPGPGSSPLGSSLPGPGSSPLGSSLPGPGSSPLGSSLPGLGPGAGSSSRGLRLFHWSSSPPPGCSLAALKQFQYNRESFSSLKPPQPSGDSSSLDRRPEDTDDRPESPSSQDSAYFSQSQPHPPSFHKEESPPHRGSHQEDQMNPEPSPSEEKADSRGSEVPGLPKPKSNWGGPAERGQKLGQKLGQKRGQKLGQKLGPARVSGLRKRPSNNENSPGVQATISSLWKNFSFRRDAQQMSPCKKGETLSPARDDVPVS